MQKTDSKPWYKQFWPWFVIALPATAVVAGLFTLYLAIVNRPDVVSDQITGEGEAIELNREAFDRAKALGVAFEYKFDADAHKLYLNAIGGIDKEKTSILSVMLLHPTMKSRDIEVTAALMPDGQYTALLETMPEGKYGIQVSAPGESWKISGHIRFMGVNTTGKVSAF